MFIFITSTVLGCPILYWAAMLLVVPAMHLVERRNQDRRLDSQRQVDLELLLDSVPDPVFLFDNEGRLVDLNRPAESLCSHTRDELRMIGIAALNSLLAARDEFDRPVSTPSMGVNRALRGETVRNVRRVFRNPGNGQVVETLTSASPIREPNGDIRGAILIVRDITEVGNLQRRLADTQRHKEVGEMAAGLAHDFNNVLDSVEQAMMLVEYAQTDVERHEYVVMARAAVKRGAEIIERVREYLQTGTGKHANVDVQEILRDVLDLTHPLWHGVSRLKIRTELQNVPKVSANAADLRRVFTNLIINALEAMPNGGELTVHCEAAGNCVRVSISDTGYGIAPEQQKQVFVPYFTTKPQGTGLGLSGARRIIDALQGQITLWSEQGKGSTFMVELPAIVTASSAESNERDGGAGPRAA